MAAGVRLGIRNLIATARVLRFTLAVRTPAGPVAQWLEPAAHNGLVAGSSPAGPTNQRKAMKVNSGAGTKFLTGLPDIITMEEDKLPFIRQDQSSQSAQCSIVTLH